MFKKAKKAFTLIEAMVVVAFFMAILMIAALIGVAGHFIAKHW